MTSMKIILVACLACVSVSCIHPKKPDPVPVLVQPVIPGKTPGATPKIEAVRKKSKEADQTHEQATGKVEQAGNATARATADLSKAKADLATLKSRNPDFKAADWLPVEYDIDRGIQDLQDTKVALECAKTSMQQEKAMRELADADLSDALLRVTAKEHEADTLRDDLVLAQDTAKAASQRASDNAKVAMDNAAMASVLEGRVKEKTKIITIEALVIGLLVVIVGLLLKF